MAFERVMKRVLLTLAALATVEVAYLLGLLVYAWSKVYMHF